MLLVSFGVSPLTKGGKKIHTVQKSKGGGRLILIQLYRHMIPSLVVVPSGTKLPVQASAHDCIAVTVPR